MVQVDKPILYVDDTEEQRYAICRILERQGFRAVEARTGAEALSALNPGLLAIVLDVRLPDMSGYDVCRRIKQDPSCNSIPIIQVSASFADPDARAVGLSGGADAYIAQPVHPQELLNLIGSLIRSSQADRMLRFMAQIGPQISQSLELAKTTRAVQEAVVPFFADRCEFALAGDEGSESGRADLGPELHSLVETVASSKATQLCGFGAAGSAIAVPLRQGDYDFGVVLFLLESGQRTYAPGDLIYAEDLAYRISLALTNARLFTAQRTAQDALIQSEKLAAAGRLTAAIAHELNNPLEAITNLLFLIETDANVPPHARTFAKDALSEMERLSHIARQSLGFYRELTTPQKFNISENVQDTLNLYARRLAAKSITIQTDFDPSLTVHAIRGEIRQVISNLIVNALDAMDYGGCLLLRTYADSGVVTVSISDDGPGIPTKNQNRIFEPFFTTKEGTGTGLGLWVSDTIVRKHNGRIQVESEADSGRRGTTMSVLLPAAS